MGSVYIPRYIFKLATEMRGSTDHFCPAANRSHRMLGQLIRPVLQLLPGLRIRYIFYIFVHMGLPSRFDETNAQGPRLAVNFAEIPVY